MYRSASSIAYVSAVRMVVWLESRCFFSGAFCDDCEFRVWKLCGSCGSTSLISENLVCVLCCFFHFYFVISQVGVCFWCV